MNAEVCDIIELVMDDHGHPGDYSIDKLEDGAGGYEVIFASFNYLWMFSHNRMGDIVYLLDNKS